MNLVAAWNTTEALHDTYERGQCRVFWSGIEAEKNGERVTGSGIDLQSKEMAQIKARSELFERISILEGSREYFIQNSSDVFQVSKSNGVASHPQLETAKIKAILELLERDAILRSWYGYGNPREVILADNYFVKGHSDLYQFKNYVVHEYKFPFQAIVTVAVGFPHDPQKSPLILGFGAESTLAASLQRSWNEGAQRFVFMKDEPIIDELPPFAPDAMYHLDYYSRPSSYEWIKSWLNERDGENLIGEGPQLSSFEFEVQDLAEAGLQVVRAKSELLFQLYFGKFAYQVGPHFVKRAVRSAIHPIA